MKKFFISHFHAIAMQGDSFTLEKSIENKEVSISWIFHHTRVVI